METDFIKLLMSEDSTAQGALQLSVRLAFSAFAGVLVALIFRRSKRHVVSRNEEAMFTTLVLLTILICMVTAVIGNSIARAFSLAGALAIVRFRTVVEDTRDTAFVIFAVVVGMAIGCGHGIVALLGVPWIFFVSLVLSDWQRFPARNAAVKTNRSALLTVRFGLGIDIEELLRPVVDQRMTLERCIEVSTTKQGAAIEAKFDVLLLEGTSVVQLVNQINKLEGVQLAVLQMNSSRASNFHDDN